MSRHAAEISGHPAAPSAGNTAAPPPAPPAVLSPAVLSPTSERLLGALFSLYRHTLSPVFAASHLGHCRYLPSCSEFAYVAVSRHGWLRGSALALRRLASCHPWAAGGLDPVPPTGPAPGSERSVPSIAGPAASRRS